MKKELMKVLVVVFAFIALSTIGAIIISEIMSNFSVIK